MSQIDLFAEKTRNLTKNAIQLAKNLQHSALDIEHFLLVCLSDITIQEVLQELNVNVEFLREQVDSFLKSIRKDETTSYTTRDEIPITDFLRIAIDTSGQAAYLLGDEQVFPEHLLLGALNASKSAACYILNDNGITWKNVIDILRTLRQRDGTPAKKVKTTSRKPRYYIGDKDSKIKILFIGSNPLNTARLRIDEENRSIQQSIEKSEYRDNFEIAHCFAVRPIDLQSYLLRHKPNIVHFSGHGNKDSSIVFENASGRPHSVSPETLGKLFSILTDEIVCVVLNACYSDKQAMEITKYVNCVIGMSDSITDKAAITFSTSFYLALGYGRDINTAFQLGCLQIEFEGLSEEDIPKLFVNNELSNAF